ncbi:MAG: hypothetical protein CVV49_12395 [Spirochaetae bacterium HGW-Spirochaetae-5]|nr:MAG: hypothetical protein CVV49_12395 [Spirochaetae bacterium HGW-Spirochaetae-5]
MSIFEIIMLICFGAAWPVSILKSWNSRTNNGKSLFFLLIVLTGYVAGILHKIFYNYDMVILLYMVNFTMITIDLFVYYRNSKLDMEEAAA